jgi:hypothetical protein
MFPGTKRGIAAAVIGRIRGATQASAVLLGLNPTWSGPPANNSATAAGTITIDDSMLPDPGGGFGAAACRARSG